MKIIVFNSADEPIYKQIENQIRDAILSNEIEDGEMLPSIRHLAAELRVSVITTNRAYENLEKEGLIISVQGKGFFVTSNTERFIEACKCKIEQSLIQAIEQCKAAKITKTELLTMVEYLSEKELS